MRWLVTGAAGFIGSAFVRLALRQRPGLQLTVLDKLTYAGHRSTLAEVEGHPRLRFVQGDIADPAVVEEVMPGSDLVVNFAAESHVDRSITGPAVFIQTNVVGTQVLLEAARRHRVGRFLQISTDEVYGSLGDQGCFTEESPLCPSSPYSASKASADLLCLAWHHTFGLPVLISRCSNNYGPFQLPEKLLPRMISLALDDQPLPIYGTGLNVRDWIHVDDHCAALLALIEAGAPGRVYNIGARAERSNLQMVEAILQLLGKPRSLISFVADRPGHDWRYALDPSRAEGELDWRPQHDLEEGLRQTVRWYMEHQGWWRGLRGG
jgi:dTDP-glucose 4,6-dehydratase